MGIPVVGAVKIATDSFTGLIIMAGVTMVRSIHMVPHLHYMSI